MDLELKTISTGSSVRNQKTSESTENNPHRPATASSLANTADELSLTDEAVMLRKLQSTLELARGDSDSDTHVSEIAKSVKAGRYQPDFHKVASKIIAQESQFFSKGSL